MTAKPNYDLSAWPLVVITVPAGDTDDADYRRHLDTISSYYERGEPFAMVVDARSGGKLSPRQRGLMAEQLKRDSERHPGRLRAMAMVIGAAAERGIVTAISWLFRPPYPMRVFAEPEAAIDWARERLGEAAGRQG